LFFPLTNQIEFSRRNTKNGKGQANVVDFDDLLIKTVQLLRENLSIAEFYQRHFQFILVDDIRIPTPFSLS